MMHRPSSSCLRLRVHARIYAENYVSSSYTLRTHTIPRYPGLLCENLSPPPPSPFAGRSVARNGCKTYAAWSILYLIRSRVHILARTTHTYTHLRLGMPRSKRAFVAIYFARGNGNGIASAARPRTRIVFRQYKWAGRQIYMAVM